jgi:hypothetical protein
MQVHLTEVGWLMSVFANPGNDKEEIGIIDFNEKSGLFILNKEE